MTILRTERLILKPFVQEDFDLIKNFYGHHEVMSIRKGGVLSPVAAEKQLQNILLHWKKYKFGLWAIFEHHSEVFMGECGLRWLEDESDIELSYGLFPQFQGRGLATEAAKEVMRYGFKVLQLSHIIAFSRGDNKKSHHVLEKLGMQFQWSKSSGEHGLVKYMLDLPSYTRSLENSF